MASKTRAQTRDLQHLMKKLKNMSVYNRFHLYFPQREPIFFVHLLLVKFHVNLNKTVSNYVLTFFVWWILKWLELVLSGGHCH